jgi:hypothetical protein
MLNKLKEIIKGVVKNEEKTMGFIGGGRVVRIILQGLKNKGKLPRQTIISDTNGVSWKDSK